MDAIEFVRWCDESRQQFVVATRADFFDRIERDRVDRFERLEFHLVIHCTGGRGRHEVDFQEVELRPDVALYVQPGQVHRLAAGDDANYGARFVAFPVAPAAPRPPAVGAHTVRLDDQRRRRLELLYEVAELRSAERPSGVVATEDGGLRDLVFSSFGFGVAGPGGDTERRAVAAFAALRDDLEERLVVGETVQHRAARLGYSTRTLDRACREMVGLTAKGLCDERLALEARRLLSLPDATSAAVAARLGFSEPTNFTKFLRRTTGRVPSDWMMT